MKSSRTVPYLLFIFASLLMSVAVYMLGKSASVTSETSHPAANPTPPAATTSTSTNPASKPQDKASGASSALQSLDNPSFSAVSASVSSAKKDIRTLIVGTWRAPSPSGGKYGQIEFFPDGTYLDRDYLT
ncbi:hypothetical protein, partial [Paenibacillus sp. HJGM_3]|uniref:hypothetical protein n=1 Tax=Paenibacillus sp. HJGM_3 TaxID=3379816 RepID=UPI0038597BDB